MPITHKRAAEDDDDDDGADVVVVAVDGRPPTKRPRQESSVHGLLERIATFAGIARAPNAPEAGYVAEMDERLCKTICWHLRMLADYELGSWVLPRTTQVSVVIGLRMAVAEVYPLTAKLNTWIAKFFRACNDDADVVLPGAKERIPGEGVGAFRLVPCMTLDDGDDDDTA